MKITLNTLARDPDVFSISFPLSRSFFVIVIVFCIIIALIRMIRNEPDDATFFLFLAQPTHVSISILAVCCYIRVSVCMFRGKKRRLDDERLFLFSPFHADLSTIVVISIFKQISRKT